MSNVVPVETPKRGHAIQVIDPVPVLDTGKFEQMQRVANVMARSSLVPEALRSGGFEEALANCFLVVNQAVRWGMDPFAVAQCCSVVKGKLMYEGKLVAAIIQDKLGVRLKFEWNDRRGDDFGITVSGTLPGESDPRIVTGTVRDWATTHADSPWKKQPRLQLAYRGAREWTRLYAPAVMLGVYTDDEMEALEHRSERSTREPPPPPALPKREPPPPPPPAARKEPPAPPASGRSSVPYAEVAKTNNMAEDASYVDLAGDAPVTDRRDPDTVVEDLRQDMSAVENADQFDRVDAAYRDAITALPPEHKAEALRIRAEHMERVG